jgi:hypothetical protein
MHAQVVDTTICNILKDPALFNGKMVRVKGMVHADFDQFIVKDQSCQSQINAIWVDYPEGTKGKAGPVALVQIQPAKNFAGTFQAVTRTPVQMDKSKDFKDFDSLLSTPHKQTRTCLGCNRYAVSATLEGRIDSVASAKIRRDPAGKVIGIDGFGNLNAYPARIVLHSVSEVVPHELDFVKADEVVKSQPPEAGEGIDNQTMTSVSNAAMSGLKIQAKYTPVFDPVQAIDQIRSAAAAFGPGSPIVLAIDRTTSAYGKHESSISIGYGTANEVSPKQEVQATHDSQDGLIFNCTFNIGRLQGLALPAATVHIGEHIADVRSPQPDVTLPTLFDLEYQAWATTALNIISTQQRTLTISGGYVLWNEFWSQAERNKQLDTAISDFLRKEELMSR